MQLLITSDWHLDWATAGYPRIADIDKAVVGLCRIARSEGVELVAFLGDLADPDSLRAHAASAIAVRVAAELWFGSGIATRWLVGNHDIIEDGSGCTTLESVKALSNAFPNTRPSGIAVYDAAIVDEFRGKKFLALPFVARSHAYDPTVVVREAANAGHKVDAVFGHLTVEGIEPGSEVADMPRGREVVLPIDEIRRHWPAASVFNGHYHRGQSFGGVYVPGSLARLTFGEENNRPGYLVAEV